MAAIEVRSVFVDAPDGSPILRGVDLEIEEGECLALIGKSGSGKSSTLRLVNGLVIPQRGEVVVFGQRLRDHDLVALRRRIGYVIQQVGLLPHLDVEANVAIVPRLLGWPEARVTARVDEVLAMVGLDHGRFRGRKPSALSGGERQRVGVARALAAEPSIVLMDEPFGAVDPLIRAELQRDVNALRKKLDATLVLVTHDVREAIAMADRIALVDEGRIAFIGTPRALMRDEHPVARAYAASLRTSEQELRETLDHGAARPELLDGALVSLAEAFRAHLGEIAERTVEHLALSFGATLLAMVVAVPLGVFASRSPRLERPLLGFVDAAQTIPSLALFGLLLPLPIVGGIGATPAVVALIVYALLPIARTTVVGIRGVDASIRDAARGLGMTETQILTKVDLPLAAPSIVAGVRVAAVTSIGTATIAAAIGAGGLGTFVFRGVAMVDDEAILLGALPAALLALVVDVTIRVIERALTRRRGG